MLPNEARTYLREFNYELTSREARAVVEDLNSWPDLCRLFGELEILGDVQGAIPNLPTYRDGFRCLLDFGKCGYVSRSIKSLIKH